jgi:hypothetical protein
MVLIMMNRSDLFGVKHFAAAAAQPPVALADASQVILQARADQPAQVAAGLQLCRHTCVRSVCQTTR